MKYNWIWFHIRLKQFLNHSGKYLYIVMSASSSLLELTCKNNLEKNVNSHPTTKVNIIDYKLSTIELTQVLVLPHCN